MRGFLPLQSLLHFFCIDSALGRFNRADLSAQMLMELFVTDIPDTSAFRDAADDFHLISLWPRVAVVDAKVITIHWIRQGMCDGALNFEFMPQTIQKFVVIMGVLYGPLPVHQLSRCLRRLNLMINRLEGAFHVADLPPNIAEVDVSQNLLSGSIDLCALPRTVTEMSLKYNGFGGTLNMEHLPDTMKYLILSNNAFTGSLNLTNIPLSMVTLVVSETSISGECVVGELSNNLWEITLRKNGEVTVVDRDGKPVEDDRVQI